MTMEMIGGVTASYLARTPCVPFGSLFRLDLEAKGLFDFQGRRGITSIVRSNPRPVILGVGNFYRCRLDIPNFGSVMLPNLPTRVFVSLLKVVTCLPSLPLE